MVDCQASPAFMRAASTLILRAQSSIRPKVSSAVGGVAESVPHTMMPRSFAACRSIAALRGPVVAISFRSGSCSISAREIGVRSRIGQMMAKPCSAFATASVSPSDSLNTVTSTSGLSTDQSASFCETFW